MKLLSPALLILCWSLAVLRPLAAVAAESPAESATTVADLLRRLEAEVRGGGYGPPPAEGRISPWQGHLEQVRQAVAAQHFEDAVESVRRILTETPSQTPGQRELWQALDRGVRALAAHRERELEARFEVLHERAKRVLADARAPAELDALLGEMTQALEPRHPPGERRVFRNEPLPGPVENLLAVRSFVAQWQTYLAQRQIVERRQQVIELLEGLAGKAAFLPRPPVARSEILGRVIELQRAELAARATAATNRLDPVEVVRTALASVASLAQLAEVQRRLRGQDGSSALPGYFEELLGLAERMEGDKEANLRRLETTLGKVSSDYPQLGARLRGELIDRAVPYLLELPADLRAEAGEARQDFLRRVAAEATRRRDWRLLARTGRLREYLRDSLNALRTLRVDGDFLDGYGNLLAGDVSERAGQMQQATLRYLDALRIGGADLPIEFLAERLAFLRANHPREYEAANKEALSRGFR